MGLFKLIELFNNVNGESNRAGIVGNGTGNAPGESTSRRR